MAAAYAALVSLLNTMNQINNHPLISTFFDEYLINQSLREKVDFFLDFVEKYSDADSIEMEDLVGRISLAAHVAGDIIEHQVADQIRAASTERSQSFLGDLQEIIQYMDSIKQMVFKFEEERGFKDEQPTYSMPTPSSSVAHLETAKTTMLGFDGYLEQLLDQLIAYNSGRQILPIVGMGGIGKTTLARNLYESLHVVHHFDIRAWATVSQEFCARKMVLQTLSCLRGSTIEMDKTDNQLCEELHKTLIGRRYLVVLDDVWSVDAWEEIMSFFPENNNGSRIVITTRQPEVVDYFCTSAIALDFLDDKNSWELFCDKAFARESCPPELEDVGKKIVDKCKGLPLAIVVIGGLLGKSSRVLEYWKKIASDISLILNSEEGNQVLSILSLSYKHMPVHLRSCFLYLGLFPEDYQIDVSQLIKFWVAEGFIKPKTDQSLEEIAESCMNELVDRKLLLVRDLSLNKKLKTCCVHDLVRDMCIRMEEKENFFCVERDIDWRRHFIVDERMPKFYPQQSTETPLMRERLLRVMRSLGYTFREVYLRFLFHESPHVGFHSLPLEFPFGWSDRVIGAVDIREMISLQGTLREVNLRFLHHCYWFVLNEPIHRLPSSISRLWSLQTLIIEGTEGGFIAPNEIWKMTQLRHIEISQGVRLPDPSGEDDDLFIMRNLQTLKKVHNLVFSEEVCKRIPNIKELNIQYRGLGYAETSCALYHLQNVEGLNKLESLHYSWLSDLEASLQKLKLPSSLKELTLEQCRLAWSDVALVGSLPHLEILQLRGNRVGGARRWNNSVEGELFLCLKHLLIDKGSSNQIYWITNSSSLPVLETLRLRFLFYLDEIPSCIGEIGTLEVMKMFECSESATISAVQILQKQESLGNESLQLHLKFINETQAAEWKEKLQLLGFTSQNLLIINIPLHKFISSSSH